MATRMQCEHREAPSVDDGVRKVYTQGTRKPMINGSQSQIAKLQYLHSGTWQPIPKWAVAMANLGTALHAAKIPNGATLVVANALPVQDWAAAFLTLGYLLAAHCGNRSGASDEAHLQKLLSFKCGTPVKLLHNGLHYDAVIAKQCGDSVEILYEQHKNKTKTKCLLVCGAKNCHKVHFIKQEQFGGVRDRGRRLSDSPDFVSDLLHGGDLVAHCLGSRTEFILVGDVGRLRVEVETPFRCEKSEGTIQDVLQIERYTRTTQDFCGVVIPAAAKLGKAEVTADTGLIVFESAVAYLRHNNTMPAPLKVILLDRSERSFTEASLAISNRVASRWEQAPEPLPVPVSPGTEAVAFLEARN